MRHSSALTLASANQTIQNCTRTIASGPLLWPTHLPKPYRIVHPNGTRKQTKNEIKWNINEQKNERSKTNNKIRPRCSAVNKNPKPQTTHKNPRRQHKLGTAPNCRPGQAIASCVCVLGCGHENGSCIWLAISISKWKVKESSPPPPWKHRAQSKKKCHSDFATPQKWRW